MNGKMLMFCKTSIQSFVYDLIDVFMYPNDEISKTYDKYEIQRCFLYQNLTDADSTPIFFVFICKIICTINEKYTRDIILEVLTKSKILERSDLSDNFWERFNVQDKSKKKQVGLYEIENIDNPDLVTIVINPKEYFEKYKDYSINKKHKGVKKTHLA